MPDVDIDGRQLKLSNLDKVLYPATGFTKGEVIDYYTRIAPVLLPHLRDRPLTLIRFPGGVDAGHFYQKQCPDHRPPWVSTVAVSATSKTINYCLCNDLATLVWVANLASLEVHPLLALASDVFRPTKVTFDLDPGPPATIVECCQVALWLRDVFDQLGLAAFPKTSGSKGMQLDVPLNTPGVSYDVTKPFAHAIAQVLEKAHPSLVVSRMDKSLRGSKVFIDWSQNDDVKTTVSVYSLRAKTGRPTVSTPLTWDEVAAGATGSASLVFEASDVLARVESMGDLFEPVLSLRQELPSL